jgi:N-acetylmuramoyl-L-alanine amidase
MHLRHLLALAAIVSLAAPSVAAADFAHTITPGESLDSIAAADGLSVSELAAENGLDPSATIHVGHTLMIPPRDTSSATSSDSGSGSASGSGTSDSAGSSSTASGTSADAGTYVVQPGDTLSDIAAREGTTVAALADANGLDPSGLLRAGRMLQLSGSGSSSSDSGSSSSGSSSADTSQTGSDTTSSDGSAPVPTAEHVSASEVGSIADANGVPPSLAKAIGWQESGFNNDVVSGADARGVMQILPGTWDWIQNNLTPSNPLAPASASENVRGGVLLLHSLLSSTGGDAAMAAAGYYQGLGSVRQRGMFSDTQQYVNSVMALRQRFGGP